MASSHPPPSSAHPAGPGRTIRTVLRSTRKGVDHAGDSLLEWGLSPLSRPVLLIQGFWRSGTTWLLQEAAHAARARAVFDRLVVAVLVNTRKKPTFAVDERAALIAEAIADELGQDALARIEVITYDGLTVDLARERGATSIVRGLRALSDFENEQAIAHLNRQLAPEIDTVFFMTGIEHAYLSSSLVREIAAFGGDLSAMVPDVVARRLAERVR